MANGDSSHLSPALANTDGNDAAAFELKFLIEATLAQRIARWAAGHLAPDPHGESALGGSYMTTSVYTDTAALDVYHRTPTYRRRKYRVRRYAANPWVFLECKNKSGDRVRKRRVQVAGDELAALAAQEVALTWPGNWFHANIQRKVLAPAVSVRYLRTAFNGSDADSPLRLTLDQDVRGGVISSWMPARSEQELEVLPPNMVILECKFLHALPRTFKALISEFRLNPAAVSKYRLCREAVDPRLRGSANPALPEVQRA